MTQCDVLYRYGTPPGEVAAMALGKVREIYGIRSLVVDEQTRTVRVEYDATRLSEPNVNRFLRGAGLDIVERVSLIPPQPEAEPSSTPAAGTK